MLSHIDYRFLLDFRKFIQLLDLYVARLDWFLFDGGWRLNIVAGCCRLKFESILNSIDRCFRLKRNCAGMNKKEKKSTRTGASAKSSSSSLMTTGESEDEGSCSSSGIVAVSTCKLS